MYIMFFLENLTYAFAGFLGENPHENIFHESTDGAYDRGSFDQLHEKGIR